MFNFWGLIKLLSIVLNHLSLPPLTYKGANFTVSSSTFFIIVAFYCSVAKSCPILWDPMNCTTPGFTALHYFPEFAQIHLHWVSDGIQQSHPLLLPSPLALNLSQDQGLSQWISCLHQVAKVLELQLQHQSFQWVFRVDLLAIQGTLKSLLQYHSLKASVLQCSALHMVQLSHPYMTTGKTIAFTIWTFVGKEMPLLCHSFSSKEQVSFNFMTAVSVHRGFRAQGNEMLLFPLFPHSFAMKWWDQTPWSLFFECWVLSQLFHSPLSPSSKCSFFPLYFLPLV